MTDMMETVRMETCGCVFEYEPDHSRPYHARWILCGRESCFRTRARLERERLDSEIGMTEERLDALRARRAGR